MNPVTHAFVWLETRLDEGLWFRRGLAITTIIITVQMTTWAASFANAALTSKADLMGVAAVIGAVSGVPVVLLTILFNKYVEARAKEGP